jgi:hypothetical protein
MTVGHVVAAVAAFALLGFLVSLARTPQMRLQIRGDVLSLRLGALDALFALRRSIVVPASDITAVLVQTHVTAPPTIRFPGTSLPGLIHAGSYVVGKDEEFWNVRRAHMFLAVHLGTGAKFRKLVLQVNDPRSMAAELRAQLQLG